MSILSGVSSADLLLDPWAHVVLSGVETPPFPEIEPANPEATRVQACNFEPWMQLFADHTGADFQSEVWRVFGPVIRERYPHVDERLMRNVCVRSSRGTFPESAPKAQFAADCQLVVNPPKPEPWTVVGPHLDNPIELYAALLYLPVPEDEAGGDLCLYRRKGAIPHGKSRFHERDVELAKTVPYSRGTLVMFVNTPEAVHGVSVRGPSTHVRRSVNIIGELRRPLYDPRA